MCDWGGGPAQIYNYALEEDVQTTCSNCQTPQGPFERWKMGLPLCKDLEGCKKRRAQLDRKNWAINQGEVRIKDE